MLAHDDPSTHPRISPEEKSYLTSQYISKASEKKPPVPWRKIFTSVPCITLAVTHICSAWGWYLMVVNLPLFLDEVFHFPVVSVSKTSIQPLW
jgi:hypothetical protein